MEQGEVLYAPGEPGKAFYIINRGVLEVLAGTTPGHSSVYLSRGDIVGEVEAFSQTAHIHVVRAHEAVSLQCFPQANFSELLRRVPAFFRYLCEQMAALLLKNREITGEQSRCLELSGRISNFDLATIYQTIVSSGQTGELNIKDEKAETIGAFYFDAGRLWAGQFQHLTGEEAFWQLFLTDNLSGTFAFSAGKQPLTDWIKSEPIAHNGRDLVITAFQFRDELAALRKEMADHATPVRAKATDLKWNGESPAALTSLADRVWALLSRNPQTIHNLYRGCSVCELKVYQVVNELVSSGQAAFT
jgi:hypothetical protein